MSVIYVVLPLALFIAAGMVWAFVRSVRKGQFDDLETPAMRMLFEDQEARKDPPKVDTLSEDKTPPAAP